MKNFKVTLWRSNPQLANGGYEKTMIVKGKSIDSVWRRIDKQYSKCLYGSMCVINVEEASENE